jgi:8-oxo-dGTP diphosphatase
MGFALFKCFFAMLYWAEALMISNQVSPAPPENFKPKFEVAACYLIVDENVLFMKRQPHKSDGNLWGIPGGRLEKGETLHQAVVREVNEETGIDLSDKTLKYFGKVYIRLPDIDFIYHMFAHELEKIPNEIVIDPGEHTEYEWMTLEEALKRPLIRGEAECICLAYGPEPKISNEAEVVVLSPLRP